MLINFRPHAGLAAALLFVAACGGDEGVAGLDRDAAAQRDTGNGDVSTDVDVPDDAAPETTPDVEDGGAADGSGDVADVVEDVVVEPTIDQTIVVAGAEALPDRFVGVVAEEGGPAIVYPLDGSAMPKNVAAPVFQWEGSSGSAYRLRITGEGIGIDVFTTDWSWQPDPGQWESLTRRAIGNVLTLQVTQLGGFAPQVGAPITLEISSSNVEGAIYFWAPSQSAIVRLPVDEDRPEVFVSGTVFSCAGCHALSPDGTRLAYTRGGGTPIGPMGVISTDASRRQIQTESLNGYYPSFSGDNVHLAVARGGDIVVINTDTGDDVATLPRIDGRPASQPAWSPREEAVVFAAGTSGGGFDALAALGVSGAGLARTTRNRDGTWNPAQWLVEQGAAAGPGENLFYPAYSPDGNWVVFNQAFSSAGAGSSPAGSELWIVNGNPATGSPPVRMSRAQGPAGTTNSWPKWAPTTTDGRMWVAFTSNRPYGRIATGGSQIWIASVRANFALAGEDPSAAAYWMPHQELTTSNHVAYWAPYRKDEATD